MRKISMAKSKSLVLVGKIQSTILLIRGLMPAHGVERLASNSWAQVRLPAMTRLQTCASNHTRQTTNNKPLVSFFFLLASFTLLLAPSHSRAQDPNFSQFEMNPLYFNPAYAGSITDLRIGLNYRNLWFNVPGNSFPGSLSAYNLYIDKQFNNALIGGLGVFAFQNFKGEGLLRHTAAGFVYAWRMPTQTDYSLSFGTKIYYNQLKIDWDRLVFSDQVDAELGYLNIPSAYTPQNDGKKNYLDIDAGVTFGFNIFQNKPDEQKWTHEFSFAVAHLIRPDVSLNGIESKLPMKYTLMYNTSFPALKNKVYLNPKFLFEKQDDFLAYTYGFNIYVVKKHRFKSSFTQSYFTKPLYLGVYFRNPKYNDLKNTKSFIVVVGHTGSFGVKDTRYQIGLSYDFTLGGLNLSTYGALELSATLVIATKDANRKKNRYCPKFNSGPLSPMN